MDVTVPNSTIYEWEGEGSTNASPLFSWDYPLVKRSRILKDDTAVPNFYALELKSSILKCESSETSYKKVFYPNVLIRQIVSIQNTGKLENASHWETKTPREKMTSRAKTFAF